MKTVQNAEPLIIIIFLTQVFSRAIVGINFGVQFCKWINEIDSKLHTKFINSFDFIYYKKGKNNDQSIKIFF